MSFKGSSISKHAMGGRLPNLPKEHQKSYLTTVWANIIRALQIHTSLLHDEIHEKNCMYSERQAKQLEAATWWLNRYIPQSKQDPETGQEAEGLPPGLVQVLIQTLQVNSPSRSNLSSSEIPSTSAKHSVPQINMQSGNAISSEIVASLTTTAPST